MKITQEADYAIRIIYFLSKQDENEKFEGRVISEEENIPIRFLHKIMRKLIKVGLINSIRGINGGFILARRPSDINLKEIIEAVDGPIGINKCLIDKGACNLNRTSSCKVHHSLKKIQFEISEKLRNTTMEDIINEELINYIY